MYKYFMTAILLFSHFAVAGTQVICRAPQNLQLAKVHNGAQLTWEFNTPDLAISYNDGKPLGLWGPELNHGLGVVFDLSAYPDATLAQLDFAHGARGTISGPYLYSIHIFNMDSMRTIAVLDSLVAGDAKDIARFEVGVDLGTLPVANRVGIFIEGLSEFVDAPKTYTFPALMSDSSAYLPQTNYYCLNVDDPWLESDPDYTNIWEPTEMGIPGATNFVMDLWINLPQGMVSLKSDDQKNMGSFQKTRQTSITPDEFIILRGAVEDSVLQEIGRVSGTDMIFTDQSVQGGIEYQYGVSTVCEQAVSEPRRTMYFHVSTYGVGEARTDEDLNGVPDMLYQNIFVKGVVSTPNFDARTDYYIQDSFGGMRLLNSNFTINLQPGDSVYVYGSIQLLQGMTTLVPFELEQVQVFSTGHLLDTLAISIADIGEEYEGRLVMVSGWVLNPQDWPAEGNYSSLVQIGNGADTVHLIVDQDTDLDGWTPPEGNYMIAGIVEQFSTSGPGEGAYYLRMRTQTDFVTLTGISEDRVQTTMNFKLFQNYPNPFNPNTSIRYQLSAAGPVELTIYNALGQKLYTLVNSRQEAGTHTLNFNAAQLASGVYYYKIIASNNVSVRKMILMK